MRHNLGAFLDSEQLQDQGIDLILEAIKQLKPYGADGRQAIMRLMNDPDPGVRVMAASEMLNDRPDLAIPALEFIRDNAVDETWSTAAGTLRVHRHFADHPELRTVKN